MHWTSCLWLISSEPRLLFWYTVITALFRCPSSSIHLTQTSPQICGPYLTARAYVSPYLGPYYNTYAAPYVDSTRPYLDTLNSRVLSPSLKYGNRTYQKYGAPRVEEARVYSVEQWERTLRPQLDLAQKQARERYDSSLAPRVEKASAMFRPYYTSARGTLTDVYYSYTLPTYKTSRLYAEKAYLTAYELLAETGLPYAQAAWGSTVIFVDRTLWPKLRILYGKNVEPQLVRIGERLGRYRDGKKLKSKAEQIKRHVCLHPCCSNKQGY